ncbi:hypothetical protein V8E52_003225 [Russula decolorans]|jgi:hypothetical protein
MRRYDIVSGILLILSIIDFALAAPVLVQEKRQASVDVGHIPKDVITVLGKRGEEELGHVVEQYFKTWEKPVESSDAHSSPGSAPPGPDHGSTNVVQAPGSSPASSTANQWPQSNEGDDEFHGVPLDSPPSSEYGSDHGLTGAHASAPLPKLPDPNPGPSTDSKFDLSSLDPPPARPLGTSQKEFGQAHASGSQDPSPPPIPASSKPSTKSNSNWKSWINKLKLKDPSPPIPASSKPSNPNPSTKSGGFNWKQSLNPAKLMDQLTPLDQLAPQAKQALSKASNPKPSTKSGGFNWKQSLNPAKLMDQLTPLDQPTPQAKQALSKASNPKPDSDFDWDYWHNSNDYPPSSVASSSRPSSSKSNPMAAHQPYRPLRIGPKVEPPEEPKNEVAPGQSPTPESTDPELNSDHQSSSADSQLADSQAAAQAAALYAAKGKAKQMRRISGTARDVGMRPRGELQPAERSLDPGETGE